MKSPGQTPKKAIAAAVIALTVFLCYFNSFGTSFHFDDFHQTINNQYAKSLGNIPYYFITVDRGSFYPSGKGYRPVVYTSFAINYTISGFGVWSYHLFNIVIHILNSLLIFFIVMGVLAGCGVNGPPLKALAAAMLFAAHPVQTDAVTYISGRSVLLSSFFCLAALLLFIKYRKGEAGDAVYFSGLPVLLLCGLLSKETAVVLPGLMLAYDATVPGGRKSAGWSRKAWAYAPVLAAGLAFISIKTALGATLGDQHGVGAWRYFITEGRAFLIYLRLLVFPFNQNMDYYTKPLQSPGPAFFVSACLAAVGLYLLVRYRKKEPAIAFFGLWFFASLAPESSIIPIPDTVREYRLYLPMAGFVTVILIAAGRLISSQYLRKAVFASILALLCVLSVSRNRVWATEETLWDDVVKKAPDSPRAHGNLGKVFFEQRMYPEAMKEFDLALLYTDPDYDQSLSVHNMRGMCFNAMGMTEDAISELRAAINDDPRFKEGYINLAQVLYGAGRYREAVEVLKKEIDIYPDYALAYLTMSKSYARMGEIPEAISGMEAAARLAPNDFVVRYDLSALYEHAGMKEKAMNEAGTCLSLAIDDEGRRKARELVEQIRAGRPDGG